MNRTKGFAIYFACLSIVFVQSPGAKLNNKWVNAESDTLYLNPKDLREFYLAKKSGEDLSNAALILSIATIPSYFCALYLADGGSTAGHFNRINLVEDIYAQGLFPMCALIMAIGNIQYKKAAQMDSYVNNSINKSLLPYFVSTTSIVALSILTNRILFTDCYHASQPTEYSDNCRDNPAGIIGASAFITVPWMRFQFSKARLHLDGLEIRLSLESQKISLIVGFN